MDKAQTENRTPRLWIDQARSRYQPSRDQVERIIANRYKQLSDGERERRVKERMARSGLAQEDLAALIGCSQNELSRIITGARLRIDPKLAEALARELDMTREQVMFGDSQVYLKAGKVPIVGEMLENETVSIYSHDESLDSDWLKGEEIEGYRVAVDTLEPRFNKGDILLCRLKTLAFEECYGRECVVEFESQRLIKHVEPGASLRVVTLRSYRAANPTIVDITPKRLTPIIAIIPAGTLG
jgi:transcriptional regulator with XRE-family HTH domain